MNDVYINPLAVQLVGFFLVCWFVGLFTALKLSNKNSAMAKQKAKQNAKQPTKQVKQVQQSSKPKKQKRKSTSHETLINGEPAASFASGLFSRKKKKALDPWEIPASHCCEDSEQHRSWDGRDPWD